MLELNYEVYYIDEQGNYNPVAQCCVVNQAKGYVKAFIREFPDIKYTKVGYKRIH